MPQNLKPLTSLRFFAAMWVVAFHFWPNLGVAMPAVVGKGYLGVELFFVLSGFILSHVYLERFRDGSFHYGEFIWARLARIYPVHISILVGLGLLMAALALVGIKAGDKLLVWGSLPAQLTLTQAWGLAPHGGWNHPSWSISAEWFAYLTFPAFAFAMIRMWARPRLAVALAAVFLVVLYIGFEAIAGFPLTRATILWGALRIVPCFALGCSLWLMWRSGVLRTAAAGLALSASAFFLLIASTSFGLPDFVSVIACGGLIFGLGAAARNGSRVLSSPALVYLGEVSFAVYMVCIPWQLVVGEGLQKIAHIDPDHMPLAIWFAMVVGVVPFAMAVHHLVERPARDLIRRVKFQRKAPLDVQTRLKFRARTSN
ncbi:MULTISPECIES: acyltransferase [Asticcacaulis]|uniref:acyltransferase family protein n=1 Tax=Asticcacaulis TaxID=76890 RepID=UPI001AE9D538|nr:MULTISPECIES: acyltransferase [Asticcacaulis]MBP2159034.1 peptidoglycan/LPS O-acetylase OafA/YrhL [Asticcacaulis solisilvae]MDR6800079.1 peptidoglycan/LPS O-acetylase OafA/YrhL [Asticcacaulis sp. BE141]